MHKDIKEILLTEEEIHGRVTELGTEIAVDYKGQELLVVGILKGAVVFYADLLRAIGEDVNVCLDFMACSSYGEGTVSSGHVKIKKDLDNSVADKHVLIVEDIVDTGNTLYYLVDELNKRGAKSVKIATLLSKPDRLEKDVHVDYIGFVIPDAFVIGYGLDYAEKYRQLKYIGVLKEEVYAN